MKSDYENPLIRVLGLKKYFPIERGILFSREVGTVRAVDGVSFEIARGETLGLAGESGCGKTTTGECILLIQRPTEGSVYFEDIDLTELDEADLRRARRRMQPIFQDPYASLNPRMTVESIIGEPLLIHRVINRRDLSEKVQSLLNLVGLDPSFAKRYPHEFSGGQRQRVGIARALALQPEFIVCDEPISSLDVSIQAQIVNLLKDLQEKLGLTFLFIAHDLSMVKYISDRVAIMYLGKVVESASTKELYANPQHPYTQALLSAVPIANPVAESKRQKIELEGEIPSPANPPRGCNFSTRCPFVMDICRKEEPELFDLGNGHFSACFLNV